MMTEQLAGISSDTQRVLDKTEQDVMQNVIHAEMQENIETEKKIPEILSTLSGPYKLRDLQDGDLFLLLRILKKINIKDFKDTFTHIFAEKRPPEELGSGEEKTRCEKSESEIGFEIAIDVADLLINNFEKIEEDVYSLWSDISGLAVDEMKKLEFGSLPLMIIETFSKARNMRFFKVLSKFL